MATGNVSRCGYCGRENDVSAVACSGCGSSLMLSREAAGADRGSDEPRRHTRLSHRVELFGAIFTLLLIFAALFCVPRFSRSLKTKRESAEPAKSGPLRGTARRFFLH